MIVQVTGIPSDQFPECPLAIPVFVDQRPPRREAGRVNFRLQGMLTKWLEQGEIDSGSPTPTLYSPGAGNPFPLLVVAGAGNFDELSAPAIERIIASMTETFLRAQVPLFGLAARDFKRPLTPARDSAEIVLRGLAHGADMAEVKEGRVIRVHWEPAELELMVQEMRRFRHKITSARDWQIEPATEDRQWREAGP